MIFNILNGKLSTGLYIGDKQISACQLVRNKKGFKLKKIIFFEINQGLIDRRRIIKDHSGLSYLIKKNFSYNNFNPKKAALSLGGFCVSFKKILIENSINVDLRKYIFSQAPKHIPFDLDEIYLDFQILKTSDNKSKEKEALIVAAKKDIIDSYIMLLKLISVKPTVIDVDIFALCNAYILNYGMSDKTALLMDINYKRTLFIVIKSQYPLCLLEIPTEYPKNTDNEFQNKIRRWHLKIENAVELFYSEYPQEKIDKAFLSGECAEIEHIQNFAQNISNNIGFFNPFKNIDINRNLFDASYIKKAAPYAGICIGLALRNYY